METKTVRDARMSEAMHPKDFFHGRLFRIANDAGYLAWRHAHQDNSAKNNHENNDTEKWADIVEKLSEINSNDFSVEHVSESLYQQWTKSGLDDPVNPAWPIVLGSAYSAYVSCEVVNSRHGNEKMNDTIDYYQQKMAEALPVIANLQGESMDSVKKSLMEYHVQSSASYYAMKNDIDVILQSETSEAPEDHMNHSEQKTQGMGY